MSFANCVICVNGVQGTALIDTGATCNPIIVLILSLSRNENASKCIINA